MSTQDFTTTFTVNQTPARAFAAINDVAGWWSGDVKGSADKLGDEFTYRYGDMHVSKQRVTEFVPAKRVVWQVVKSKLHFVKNKDEWNGTKLVFDIVRRDGKTQVRFTHAGLLPAHECFEDCASAWSSLIKSNLRKLITLGERAREEI
jgi:hypothetical protein